MKIIGEKLFQLSKNDLIKGMFLAFVGAILKAAETWYSTNTFPSTLAEWQHIAIVGLKVAGAYAIKQLLTNSKDQLFKAEPKTEDAK